jgi:hypothetical protein
MDLARGDAVGSYLDRRVRAAIGDHWLVGKPLQTARQLVRSRPVADAFGAPVLRDQGPIGRPGTARPIQASSRAAGYLSVWSSISALGALRLTDSMPLIGLALLS